MDFLYQIKSSNHENVVNLNKTMYIIIAQHKYLQIWIMVSLIFAYKRKYYEKRMIS